jgi:hypothetical protein
MSAESSFPGRFRARANALEQAPNQRMRPRRSGCIDRSAGQSTPTWAFRPDAEGAPRPPCSKIGAVQIVSAFAATRINLGSSRVNQFSVLIEGAQQSGFVKPHIGLNLLQRVFRDEKRSLHRGVISPKAHGAPRRIKRAASIWKIQRHDRRSPRSSNPSLSRGPSSTDN